MTAPLKFAVLGTANIANDVSSAIRSAGHIVEAVASRDLNRAREWAEKRDIYKYYGSYQDALNDPSIDAVYIPLPTTIAEEWALKAALQKKHVLVDKPFSSSASVKHIAEACERNEVVFLDGTHFVHSPRLQEMQRQIKQGTIGRLLKISVACTTFLPSKDDIRYNPSLEPTGCLGDIGWYAVRFALSFIGYETKVSSVYASASKTPTGAIEDCCGIIHFVTGQTVHFDCGFTCGFRQWGECVGERGTVTVDDFIVPFSCGGSFFPRDRSKYNPNLKFRINKLAVEKDKKLEMIDPVIQEIEVSGNNKSQSAAMVDTFASLVRNETGATRSKWTRETIRTQELIDALFKSCQENNVVYLE
ncbi:hypothetical protein GpartN1_g2475.t1 [Galdieria partita]|uniref:Oxidoreductase n=1 Tax=Galdieria partita TaxID=83374 RepID=A0A9C7PUW9_9RHOD|nr:hypothetical protein GpartN1_g2475.t1 [Galdieria partita]